MSDNRNIRPGKRRYLYGLILLSFIALICAAFGMTGSNDFITARREVLLRRLGHEILLQSGDSTSRVLPVKKIAENEYQIRFEKELTFHPELLVNTTRRLLAQDPRASDYVVNVLNNSDASVAYGYAISNNQKDDIVACLGRKQPRAPYMIHLKFKPRGINIAKNGYLLGGLPLLAFVGFVVLKSVKPRRVLPDRQEAGETSDKGLFTLGAVLFDVKNRKLMIHGDTVDLTGTETRVLHIFASSPNETIERSRLQKEIWEDEGVIVGRSLDMFISKLRKKLEAEPGVKIVVIRGKGYRLEVSG